MTYVTLDQLSAREIRLALDVIDARAAAEAAWKPAAATARLMGTRAYRTCGAADLWATWDRASAVCTTRWQRLEAETGPFPRTVQVVNLVASVRPTAEARLAAAPLVA